MNQSKFSLELANAEYCFLHVEILCDASKQIFFSSIVCHDCKSAINLMLGHFVMHPNKFCFEVMNAVILQDFCFLPDGTLCDVSKHFFEVLYAVIARVIFSSCWDA